MSLSHIGICTPNDYPTYVTSGRMSDLFFAEAVLGEPMRKKMAKITGMKLYLQLPPSIRIGEADRTGDIRHGLRGIGNVGIGRTGRGRLIESQAEIRLEIEWLQRRCAILLQARGQLRRRSQWFSPVL